jgi:ABC-type molybdate transport system ATPase subunit
MLSDYHSHLYNINSRLVPFLKYIYASVQISNIFVTHEISELEALVL